MTRRTIGIALVALALPLAAPAAAQVPTLDRVDSLIAAGAYDEARSTIETWWSARETFDVPGSDRVRALMLRARLRTDPAAAEEDYLTVVLGHPTSPHAPEALLRLGQALLATGQPGRAAGYLQRLAADYPGQPERLWGLLWLARSYTAIDRPAAACSAAREGLLGSGPEPQMAAMFRIEEAAACRIGGAVAAGQGSGVTAEPVRRDQPTPTDSPAAGAPAGEAADQGRFSVQTGAFRHDEGAEALMKRLRNAGFEPRAVRVPLNDLLRIRVGRFTSAAGASALVRRLKAAGFDAFVVGDADEERAR